MKIDRKKIKEAWSSSFRLANIGFDDNFFEIGGHSLIAGKIIAILAKQHNVKISASDIFNFPTINKLAKQLEKGLKKDKKHLLIEKCDQSLNHPLSLVQKRLWFLYKLRPDIPLYSVPISIKVLGDLDVSALRFALNNLMKRHESLRMNVKVLDGLPFQRILPTDTQFPMEEERIESFENEEVVKKLSSKISIPFKLEEDILCRCLLLHLSKNEKILCFIFHHIIFDDWSMDVFSRELSFFYHNIKNGLKRRLEPLKLQYIDFSVSQDNFLNSSYLDHQFSYWSNKLSNISPMQLPTDFERPKLLNYYGNVVQKKKSKTILLSLKKFAAQQNITLFIFLLACFKWSLSLFTNLNDIIVGSPVSNRPFADQKNVIGYFINTFVLRTIFSREEDFLTALNAVKTTVLEAHDHQDVPFEKIVSMSNIVRELNKNPLFQVMFSIGYDSEISNVKLSGTEIAYINDVPKLSKFDLGLHAQIKKNSIEFNFEYLTELFTKETILAFSKTYFYIMKSVIANPTVNLSQIALQITNQKALTNTTSFCRTFKKNTEVESTLLMHPNIKKAAVKEYIDSFTSEPLIIAYVTPHDNASLNLENLLTFLNSKMTTPIFPDKYIIINSIPFLESGEIDYEKLNENSGICLDTDTKTLVSNLENNILIIWKQLLKKETLNLEDNFFELGGNSLLTVQLCALIKQKLNIVISIIDTFKYPTIKSMAKFCANKNIINHCRKESNVRRNLFLKSLKHFS